MTHRIVVTGTGTEIGKTHVAAALVARIARTRTVAGVKPVESGVAPGTPADADRLSAVSTFHVKHLYTFDAPVAPHLAARHAGAEISVAAVRRHIDGVTPHVEVVVVELPGGLFSPLSETHLNVDVIRDLAPVHVVLVAPDRLGVLHDTLAAAIAARAVGVAVDTVVLNAPDGADASTGTNAHELRRLLPYARVFGPLLRGACAALAASPPIAELENHLLERQRT